MPETDYNEVYDSQGNVIERTPVIISDDEVLLRQLAEQLNSYHTQALQAYRNWGSLTPPQKDVVLKQLVGYYLASGERLGFFRLS